MGFDMFADPGGLLFDSYYGEILLQLCVLSYGVYVFAAVPRNPSVFEQRLTWNKYSDRHTKRGTFHRRLRMSRVSFDKLLAIIKVDLAVDEAYILFMSNIIHLIPATASPAFTCHVCIISLCFSRR